MRRDKIGKFFAIDVLRQHQTVYWLIIATTITRINLTLLVFNTPYLLVLQENKRRHVVRHVQQHSHWQTDVTREWTRLFVCARNDQTFFTMTMYWFMILHLSCWHQCIKCFLWNGDHDIEWRRPLLWIWHQNIIKSTDKSWYSRCNLTRVPIIWNNE